MNCSYDLTLEDPTDLYRFSPGKFVDASSTLKLWIKWFDSVRATSLPALERTLFVRW